MVNKINGSKKLKLFEILSATLTIIVGSLLHFLFEWSGSFEPLALIAAVNESTWEHLKLAFWPAFIFAAIGYFSVGHKQSNFLLAQAVKLFLMPSLIVILFYGWLAFFSDNFVYDILIFILSITVGHFAAYRLEITKKDLNQKILSLFLVIILLLSFSFLTYFPPKNFLFRDPITGSYGIR